MSKDELLACPVFLIQSREITLTEPDLVVIVDGEYLVYKKDLRLAGIHDDTVTDDDGEWIVEPMTDDEIVERQLGVPHWLTRAVAYSREDGEMLKRRYIGYGSTGRVYAVPAVGELSHVLNEWERSG